jgi:hypothetical protein
MTDTKLWKYYPHEGQPDKEELTEKEEWCWIAEYSDGTILKQFDDAGYYHYFREINQEKLSAFSMVHAILPPITLTIRPGLKLIHYHTNYVYGLGNDQIHIRFPCFGYEGFAEGKKEEIKLLICLLPDGRQIITDDSTKLKLNVENNKMSLGIT